MLSLTGVNGYVKPVAVLTQVNSALLLPAAGTFSNHCFSNDFDSHPSSDIPFLIEYKPRIRLLCSVNAEAMKM